MTAYVHVFHLSDLLFKRVYFQGTYHSVQWFVALQLLVQQHFSCRCRVQHCNLSVAFGVFQLKQCFLVCSFPCFVQHLRLVQVDMSELGSVQVVLQLTE